MENERTKLDAKRIAFESGASIAPPTEEQVVEAKGRAEAADQLIADQHTADAAIALGRAAVEAFNQIQA